MKEKTQALIEALENKKEFVMDEIVEMIKGDAPVRNINAKVSEYRGMEKKAKQIEDAMNILENIELEVKDNE